MSTGQRAVSVLFGWEGNRRFRITDSEDFTYGLNGLRKWDELPVYIARLTFIFTFYNTTLKSSI